MEGFSKNNARAYRLRDSRMFVDSVYGMWFAICNYYASASLTLGSKKLTKRGEKPHMVVRTPDEPAGAKNLTF